MQETENTVANTVRIWQLTENLKPVGWHTELLQVKDLIVLLYRIIERHHISHISRIRTIESGAGFLIAGFEIGGGIVPILFLRLVRRRAPDKE